MASGMGQPAIGIYSYELFKEYDVKNIIRIGSCGSLHPDLHLKDLIIAQAACTDGNYAIQYRLPGTFAPIADFGLLKKAVEEAEEEFVLEKPKLQNFKEELEQEEREAEEKAAEETKEKKEKPDIGEVIEEFKRKNKSKDGSLSYSDNSNNSFILNNK
jgi:purine-nucleoside phosphorylase